MLNNYSNSQIISCGNNPEQLKKHLLIYDFNFTAGILKLLASTPKLKILLALTEKKEFSIDEIADVIGTSNGTASRHLRVLKELGFVKYQKDQRKLLYSIKSKQINDLIIEILELGKTS